MLQSILMELDRYEISQNSNGKVFTFISRGFSDIVKVVRYDELNIIYRNEERKEFKAYNLGFGNKMEGSFEFDDKVRSNNGDMYRVFNSVLFTIPIFFQKFNDSAIHVKGSDQIRHLAYHRFINQRYQNLTLQYRFYGSINGMLQKYNITTIFEYIVILPKMT